MEEILEMLQKLRAALEISKGDTSDLREKLDVISDELVSKETLDGVESEFSKAVDEIRDELAAINAKAMAPAIHVDSKSESDELKRKEMDVFNTFAKEGVDSARQKAAGDDIQVSVDAQGGYAVPEELRQEIIRIQQEQSPMRQVCSVRSSETTDVKQLVSVGDAASGWVGETGSRTQTDVPQFAQRTGVFGEIYANPLVYQHALEDAFFDVPGYIAEEVARQFKEQEDLAFLSGNGTNKPKGIIDGLTAGADAAKSDVDGTPEVIDSGVAAAFGASDSASIDFLRTVPLALATPYLANSKWMMNRSTHNTLINLKNSDGEYFLQRSLTEAGAESLFGFPIVINDDIDSLGTDKIVALFGDFERAYEIIDRVGISMLRDPYSSKGSVSFYTRKRVGSMIKDVSAYVAVSVT